MGLLSYLTVIAITHTTVCRAKHVWHTFDAPVVDVDLDKNASSRWTDAVMSAIDKHGWEYSFKPALDFINTIVETEVWTKYDDALQMIAEPIVGEEITEELASIVKTARALGHDEVTLSQLQFFQIFYELLMQCTGVLARDENGRVYHGRNMDIGLPLENITVQVNWKRGNRSIAISTQYLGYQGIHTGMRVGGWSVQANERVVLNPGPSPLNYERSSLLLTVESFLAGHKPLGSVLRDILLRTATYDEALPLLEKTSLASPVFFVVGGLTDGSVITRGRDGLAKTEQDTSVVFGTPKPVPSVHGAFRNMSSWLAVETNWDPWVVKTSMDCQKELASWTSDAIELCDRYILDVYNDPSGCSHVCMLYSDGRAEAAREYMGDDEVSSTNATQVLFDALSKEPVLQPYTKFTSIMSASLNMYNTTVRRKVKVTSVNDVDVGVENDDVDTVMRSKIESLRFLFKALAPDIQAAFS